MKTQKLIILEKESLSNCCFEPIYSDSDICSKCKEHCGELKFKNGDYYEDC